MKRIRAVQIVPTSAGLTVIGGNNGQGKTSVLDAIAWALGGDRYRPQCPYPRWLCNPAQNPAGIIQRLGGGDPGRTLL